MSEIDTVERSSLGGFSSNFSSDSTRVHELFRPKREIGGHSFRIVLWRFVKMVGNESSGIRYSFWINLANDYLLSSSLCYALCSFYASKYWQLSEGVSRIASLCICQNWDIFFSSTRASDVLSGIRLKRQIFCSLILGERQVLNGPAFIFCKYSRITSHL